MAESGAYSGRAVAQPRPGLCTLKVKNNSETESFALPTDLFFNRSFDSNSSNKPYTCVEILDKGTEEQLQKRPDEVAAEGGSGGLWRQKDAFTSSTSKGTEYNRVLKPGESMEMIVCTDPANASIKPAVSGATDLLWRIHLRCGFVQEDNNYGTITTIIGVPFKSSDIADEG